MRALILLLAAVLSMPTGAQEAEGYFGELLELYDFKNDGPQAVPQIQKYTDFTERGAIAGVKLGLPMSEAVAAWGKPRKVLSYLEKGRWRLNLGYGRACSLGFSENRLVNIDVMAEDLVGCRFDNGIRSDMTRAEIIAILGEPFHKSDDGIFYRADGGKTILFRFRSDGHRPKGAEEWNTAKLWAMTIEGTDWVKKSAKPATPDGEGYFAKISGLHDLKNDGPKAVPRALVYKDFAGAGAICGVKLGISMSKAVAAWGNPRGTCRFEAYWILDYSPGCHLLFNENRLVSVSVRARSLPNSRFDNGIRSDMTRAEIIAILGTPFHTNHAGISYKVGGRRVVNFHFQIDGQQWPKNNEDWRTAKLWVLSINGTEWVKSGMPPNSPVARP